MFLRGVGKLCCGQCALNSGNNGKKDVGQLPNKGAGEGEMQAVLTTSEIWKLVWKFFFPTPHYLPLLELSLHFCLSLPTRFSLHSIGSSVS
jgi:hypothetical protein